MIVGSAGAGRLRCQDQIRKEQVPMNPARNTRRIRHIAFLSDLAALVLFSCVVLAQTDSVVLPGPQPGAPVTLDEDTLFFVRANLGPFTPEQRAAETSTKLRAIVKAERVDSVTVVEAPTGSNIMTEGVIIMAVTDEDAALMGRSRTELAHEYAAVLRESLERDVERYSTRSLLINSGITVGVLLGLALVFWGMSKLFPRIYTQLERWEGTVFRPVRIRSHEILSAGSISGVFIVLAKGVRLALSLALIYFSITYVLSLFPLTQHWKVKPVLIGIFLSILTTTAAIVLLRTLNSLFGMLTGKIEGWKGTAIKGIKLKTVEILSKGRIAEIVRWAFKVLKLFSYVVLGYFYITIIFGLFTFTQTWAVTLFGYILTPLWNVLSSFVAFLPNLFFILVTAYVTRYVIKFIKLFFDEIGRGRLALPGFYSEWADPTYKIVRFLILAFAAIVIFPYLPGSSSPVFQGVSVFLGILFSLGSTSAIANVVAGVVITYMRPFKIGDRVKIADTVGDITEKTLLVTRVRTIKNVDITIPNSMVLGSHIINFSSSAKGPGLVLHTGVTIGYDAPWTTVHSLLLAAADATANLLKEPRPFVFQTSLDDFHVSYELNAYTDQPNIMAQTYSDLHQNIQDKFNEAGVEIMSPHYSAVRDGNQTTVPETYLPKSYQAPAFRIFPLGDKGARSSKLE
jgi:small-conductance mechanosensitive channel